MGTAFAVFGLATHRVFPDSRTITSHERWTVAGLFELGQRDEPGGRGGEPDNENQERGRRAVLFRRRRDRAGSAGALVGDGDVGSDVRLSGRGHA